MNVININRSSKVLFNGEVLKGLLFGKIEFGKRRGLDSFVLSLNFECDISDPVHDYLVFDCGEVDVKIYPNKKAVDSWYELSATLTRSKSMDDHVHYLEFGPGPGKFIKI